MAHWWREIRPPASCLFYFRSIIDVDITMLRAAAMRMCNLYRMTKSVDEMAGLFNLANEPSANIPTEVFPGYPGLVFAEGTLRPMVWGFPMSFKSKKTGKALKPKPVNNARSDKLQGYPWEFSFKERRCLIPLTAWCEAEGPRGAMTRTWMSLPDIDAFTVAGIWRGSDEWGECYSMVMTDAAGDAATVHSRMPVILRPEERGVWTDAHPAEAHRLCAPYKGRLHIERTGESWRQ